MKFDAVTERSLHECYMALAHNVSKIRLENIRIKKQQNRNR